jgi:RecJ-like exonuclease
MKTCPECNGDGVVEKGTDDEQQCPTCGGCGFVPDDDDGQEEVINTRQPIDVDTLNLRQSELASSSRLLHQAHAGLREAI